MSERDGLDEPSGWYERWLWEVAGERHVRTLPLFLVWVVLIAAISAIVYLAGGRTQRIFGIPLVPASALYWAVAVPAYVQAHYRDR